MKARRRDETIPIWVESAAGAVRQSPHAREGKNTPGKLASTRGVAARHGKSD
jgi:hypothetical protein